MAIAHIETWPLVAPLRPATFPRPPQLNNGGLFEWPFPPSRRMSDYSE